MEKASINFVRKNPFMRYSKFIVFLLLLSGIKMQAQFFIGYTGAHTNPRELNREIYIYNQINGSNLKKEMPGVHWLQGPSIGFRSKDDLFLEIQYSRKKGMVKSEFDSAGVPMNRQMKVYSNTYNFGIGYRSNGWGIGCSVDFGRYKGFGRRGTSAGLKDLAWEHLWVIDHTRILGISVRLYMAGTVWVERSFGELVTLRLYSQLGFMKMRMDGLDHWMFGGDLNYGMPSEEKLSSTGVTLFLNFGKK
jgi:hypothetical protein